MTLFIADTNDRIRQCLASLAACVEGIEVVGEAGDVQEAIGGIKRAKPDSVIVALQMSGGSGLDVLSAAKSTNPAAVIIMLSVDERRECKLECLALGADYFFQKSGEIKKIVTTLVLLAHQSYRERIWVDQDAAQNPTRCVPGMSGQSDSIPSSVAATYARIAAFPRSKSNGRLLACSASHTTSRLVLPQTPATAARFPPSGSSPYLVLQ
jgi:DNA-binding NarL/FixJ family response regulator